MTKEKFDRKKIFHFNFFNFAKIKIKFNFF
jgi:hypothetical protein